MYTWERKIKKDKREERKWGEEWDENRISDFWSSLNLQAFYALLKSEVMCGALMISDRDWQSTRGLNEEEEGKRLNLRLDWRGPSGLERYNQCDRAAAAIKASGGRWRQQICSEFRWHKCLRKCLGAGEGSFYSLRHWEYISWSSGCCIFLSVSPFHSVSIL